MTNKFHAVRRTQRDRLLADSRWENVLVRARRGEVCVWDEGRVPIDMYSEPAVCSMGVPFGWSAGEGAAASVWINAATPAFSTRGNNEVRRH